MRTRAAIISILFGMLFSGTQVVALDSPAGTRPNIVVILADDLGYGDLGVNGARRIQTTNIDALARGGVNFSEFYASGNICTPSRAGLMTGRYPVRTGLAYDALKADSENGLPRSEETLAALAKRAGYSTMLVGKWHLGRFPEYHPTQYGFDQFYGVPYSNDMRGFALYRGNELIETPVEQSTLTRRYTREAISFIEQYAGRPFLLFVSHTMPHIPLYVTPEFAGSSAAGLYGDVVQELDASVGDIVEALRAAGVYDNTLIFVTSDNGPFFEGSTAGLKGGKGSGWEGGFRVPLVVSWPDGKLAPGSRASIAMNIDILPTVAEVLEVPPGADAVDGKSLLPVLKGGTGSAHDYLYYFNNEEVIGVRSQRWKFITHAYYRRSLGAFEKFDQLPGFTASYDMLYEAGSAGGEEYSYADRHPEVVKELKAELASARRRFEPLRTHPPDQTFPR